MPQKPRLAVVDASVVLKWQLDDEEHIPQATTLRNDFYAFGVIKATAPHLLIYEVINGIVTATRRKGLDAMNNLIELGIGLKGVEAGRVMTAPILPWLKARVANSGRAIDHFTRQSKESCLR